MTCSALALAAGLSLVSARLAADVIEQRSAAAVKTALIEAGHEWAEIHADGLQVHLGGQAPTEAIRFNALSVSGRVVDAARVIDGSTVTPSQPLAPPRFSVELLRNDDGVSLIGLVPGTMNTDTMVGEISKAVNGAPVRSFVESADYPVPEGWVEAAEFALTVLEDLPRSKISIAAGEVKVTAITSSQVEKRRLETELARRAPDALQLRLRISAPRPVITPYTLRFVIDASGPRFDACSAEDREGRNQIMAAARAAGLEGQATCTEGLGQPTPDWPDAAVMAINALAEIGAGSVTFSDADVALVVPYDTSRAVFDKVVGELESNLPDVFSLASRLPDPPVEATDEEVLPPEFVATRSPEGQVQLRGRLPNDVVRSTVESFARARFGVDNVYMAARLDTSMPEDWAVRVLAGLRALSELDHGAVTVLESNVDVSGVSGNQSVGDDISRVLTDKLGETATYELRVRYDETLDPLAALPTAQECIDRITAIQAEKKITFSPGSTEVEGAAAGIVDAIADVLRQCRKVDMTIQIAGHTDSQGREQMNLELSETRAQAVLDALVARRVLTSKITAKGYGETVPIADNGTDEGREANRRIEFRLLVEEDETGSVEEVAAGSEDATAEAGVEGGSDE